jgi:hypothetical protein
LFVNDGENNDVSYDVSHSYATLQELSAEKNAEKNTIAVTKKERQINIKQLQKYLFLR